MQMQLSASMETRAAVLPDEVLAAGLGLLPPRSLAASRCVWKSWRALVDEHRLLLRHVLPHSVRGLLINFLGYERPHLLSRPTPADAVPRVVDAKFGFIATEPDRSYEVVDHCNGLVLYGNTDSDVMYVCNPATRWWVRLPPPPPRPDVVIPRWSMRCHREFLVFDPVMSPHYTVLVAPVEPNKCHGDDACRLMQWPPSPWTWLEFSSRTRSWEEKAFVREGEAAGTVEGLLWNLLGYSMEPRWRYAAYWQGSLYLHGHGEYESRMSLLNDTYRVIKSPIELAEIKNDDNNVRSFLGKSKDGIYFAAINDTGKLRVWTLSESTDQTTVWESKHQSSRLLAESAWWSWYFGRQDDGPWILDVPSNKNTNRDASTAEQNFCWNSDDDDIIVDAADDDIMDAADDEDTLAVEPNFGLNFDDDGDIMDVTDDEEGGFRFCHQIPWISSL